MLVSDTQLFLLILLLIFNNKIIEKDFVKFIEILFNRDLNPLFCGLLILRQAQLF